MKRTMLIATGALLMMSAQLQAGDCGRKRAACCPVPCQPCATSSQCAPAAASAPCGPAYQVVEQTVMVPTYVTQKQKIKVVKQRLEERKREVTVMVRVPVKTQHTRNVTTYVRETKSRDESYTVCKPVWKEREITETYLVPHTEVRKGTHKVWECVQVKRKHTVCEDQGHWAIVAPQPAAANCNTNACGHCGKPCGRSYCSNRCANACATTCASRVWIPKIVKRDVEFTTSERVLVERPFEQKVTVCKPVARKRKVKYCEMVRETRTRKVNYAVCVPKTEVQKFEVTSYKCEPKKQTITETVCVPYTVEQEIEVQVCKLVAKKVTRRVPVQSHCAARCCN